MDKMDKKQDATMVKKAMRQHDAQKHKGSKPTTLKLKKGGPTSEDMRSMGRNMARAKNQGGK